MSAPATPLAAVAPRFEHFDSRATWRILVRDDRNGNLLGELEDYSSATVVARFNDVGTWEVTSRLTGIVIELLAQKKTSLVVRVGGNTVLSGPVTHIERTWDQNGDSVTLSGVDDLVWAAVSVIPTTTGQRTFTGRFHWVLAGLFHAATNEKRGQAGQVWPPLTIDGGEAGGTECSFTASWSNTLAAMQAAAAQSSPTWGFDCRDLTFESWLPSDPGIVFSAQLGTMAGFQLTVDRPDANFAYLLGKGWDEGPGEWLTVEDQQSRRDWWRLEEVIDVSSAGDDPQDIYDEDEGSDNYGNVIGQVVPDNVPKYRAAGQDALDKLVKVPAVQVTPIDTSAQQFGLHYGLGDVATVVLPEGYVIKDTITEVTIALRAGEPLQVTPTVGQAQMGLDTFRRLARVDRRLDRQWKGGT
jgi:hypothetical protein